MWAICQLEFFRLFKSMKSLITVAFIVGVSYWVSDLVNQAASFLPTQELAKGHALGVFALVMLFGPLFVFSLSHDVLNRELAGRTIRFLVTRTSRQKIIVGKFLGVLLFWLACMVVTFGVVLATVHTFDAKTFYQCVTLLVYCISLALLLSLAVPRPSYTMFLGIVVAMALPGVGLWSLFSSHPAAQWIAYLTPFKFIEKGVAWTGFIWLYAALFLTASIFLFRRRDC
ncbi:ABC transporter permease [Brevibacillus choshinensis]|uniref:ABC transporter permease n=1 Tax=Brevibacillus choshinensis TaxID=54911 RepID=UPI002E1AA56B|nr:ABC transporter permease subunit [Brevibacillus choshinensis]MED4583390.1 ABC transporter permease subunit [Brevibacillus choshinensis]MED4752675.1 ABC transporter permease subunit [Brevibacillus choshinensis]